MSVKVKKNTLITTPSLSDEQMLEVLVNRYVEYRATEIILLKKGLIDENVFEPMAKEDAGVIGEIESLVSEYSNKMGLNSVTSAESKIGTLLKKKA